MDKGIRYASNDGLKVIDSKIQPVFKVVSASLRL